MADPRRARSDRSRAGQRRRSSAPRRGQPSPDYRSRRRARGSRGPTLPLLFTVALVVVVVMTLGPLGVLGGALGGPSTSGEPSPSVRRAIPRPPAPILPGPAERVTGELEWDLDGQVPGSIARAAGYTIRVFVNGKRARQRPLGNGASFRVTDLELRRGWNEVAASIGGPGGQGPRSRTIRVLVDQRPPPVDIDEPTPNDTINARHVVVRGRTQPRSSVEILNERTRRRSTGEAPRGRFAVQVPLGRGANRLVIRVIDAGGNETVERLRVRRGEGKLSASLSISAALVPVETLPRTLLLRVDVRDPDGEPINGARVTFSLSPPGLPTATYEAVTRKGIATWEEVTIPREGAVAGDGFATVLVVLRSGRMLRDTVRFRFSP